MRTVRVMTCSNKTIMKTDYKTIKFASLAVAHSVHTVVHFVLCHSFPVSNNNVTNLLIIQECIPVS